MNKSRLFLGSLFLSAVLIWTAFFIWPSKNLEVAFCDVGQGDAEFIQSPSGFQMLIDGGPSDRVLECLARETPFWDRSIDLVVLSHPHADHLTGLISVLKRYNVGQILETDAVNDSPEFSEWQKLIQEKKIPLEVVYQVSGIDLGAGAKADILYPKESFKDKKIDNLNNTSIVFKLNYRDVSFLFPGDLEEKEQKKLISITPSLLHSVTFLKVPHHGSKNALDLKFLELVHPKVAFIEVGKNNYGHPSQETINKLENIGAEIKRTDKDGTTVAEVDRNGKWKIK